MKLISIESVKTGSDKRVTFSVNIEGFEYEFFGFVSGGGLNFEFAKNESHNFEKWIGGLVSSAVTAVLRENKIIQLERELKELRESK